MSKGLQRSEILSFLVLDFPEYTWSIRTLDWRIRHFNIYYTDGGVIVEQVVDAVKQKLAGPGKHLGIRAMDNKLRQKHAIKVPRDLVHAAMTDLDPIGVAKRGVGFNKQKGMKGNFTTRGKNWVYSMDGHAKLMGYQRDTFPIAIYGCIDTASRKLLWIKVWTSNSNHFWGAVAPSGPLYNHHRRPIGHRWRLYKEPEGATTPQKFYWPLRWPPPTFLEGYKILNFEYIVY